MERSKLKRSIRTCEVCTKEFEIRDCYLKRTRYKNGRFCSPACRQEGFKGTGNPRASEYAVYGSKKSENLRHLAYYQRVRLKALARLGNKCVNCGCDELSALQVNHLKDFSTNQSGAVLWRHILKISEEELRAGFDLRCELCNWHFFMQQKYPNLSYSVEWRGRKCAD